MMTPSVSYMTSKTRESFSSKQSDMNQDGGKGGQEEGKGWILLDDYIKACFLMIRCGEKRDARPEI